MIRVKRIFAVLLGTLCLTGCAASEPEGIYPDPTPLIIHTEESSDIGIVTVLDENGNCLYQYRGAVDIWMAGDGNTYINIQQNNQVLQ
jgi:hypothetical protein